MATGPPASLGTKIRRARERKRWTQRQLADAVGVNIKTIDNWENDRTSPRSSIGALEEVFGVDLSGEPGPESVIPPDLLAQIRRDIAPEDQPRVIAALERELGGTTAPREEAGSSSPDHRRRAG